MRAAFRLIAGLFAVQIAQGAPAGPETEALSKIPPEQAVVLDPAADWQSVHWPDSPHSRIVGIDQDGGYPRMVVAESGKRHPWANRLAAPFDPNQYPIVVLTYRATGILASDERLLWLDDTSGAAKGRVQPFLNRDVVADGEVHEAKADLREFSPKGPIIIVRVYPHCHGPEPAVFELLGLRFEADPDKPVPEVKEGNQFQVKVLDDKGAPIKDAWLTVDAERLNWCRSAQTGADGMAAVQALGDGAGRHALRIEADGMVPIDRRVGNAQAAPLVVRMVRAATYGGKVVDEAGRPVPNASVEVQVRQENGIRTATSLTDQDGRWQAAAMPAVPGDMAVTVRHLDYVSEGASRPSADELRNGEATLVLREGVLLRGTVTGPDGTCLACARVRLGADRWQTEHPVMETTAEGLFEFPHSIAGRAILTVHHPDFAPKLLEIDVKEGMEEPIVELEPPATICGRVVDGADESPLGGVRVAVSSWRGHHTLTWNMVTGDDGLFVWDGAPQDEVHFQFTKEGYQSLYNHPLTPSADEQVVTMRGPLRLHGTVRDAVTGKPVADCKVIPGMVWHWPGGPAEPPRNWIRPNAVEVIDGQYALTLHPNRYGGEGTQRAFLLRTEAKGYAPQVSGEFSGTDGKTQFDFSLQPAADICGTVRFADGKPAAGVPVFLVSAGSGLSIRNGQVPEHSNSNQQRTDAAGSFAFPTEEAPWRLVAIHDSGYGDLDAATHAKSQELVLQPWARVEGISHVNGKPIANCELRIDVIATQAQGEAMPYHQLQAVADGNGRFAFPRVPPGRGIVGIRTKTGPHFEALTRGEVCEFKPGEATQVTIGGNGQTVVGKLMPAIDWSDVQPHLLARRDGMTARVLGPLFGRPRMYGVAVDANGSFRAEALPPGLYQLTAMAPRAGIAHSYEFTVPKATGEEKPLDLGALEPQR